MSTEFKLNQNLRNLFLAFTGIGIFYGFYCGLMFLYRGMEGISDYDYLIALVAGYLLSTVVLHFLNGKFEFLAYGATGLILNIALGLYFGNLTDIPKLVIPLLNLIFTLPASIAISRYWKRTKYDTEKMYWVFFISLCAVLYLFIAVVVPFNRAPDEHMRFDIPMYIYEHGSLPLGYDESLRNINWGYSYGFQPSLSAIISALFMKISFFLRNAETIHIAARITSILSAVGTLIFAQRIGKRIFTPSVNKLFVLTVGLLPQFAFISGYVNNDAFGIFTVTFIIYGMILGYERKWDYVSCIVLGVACGLCTLSYYNCCAAIGAAFIFYSLVVLFNKKIEKKPGFYFRHLALIFIVAFLVAGWAFIRNAAIYDGDFTGLAAQYHYGELYGRGTFKPSKFMTPARLGWSVPEMIFEVGWLDLSSKSFIASFGYLEVFISDVFYFTMFTLAGIGIVLNIIFGIIDRKKSTFFGRTFTAGMVILCAFVIILSIYYSYSVGFQPQGRYLMPMVVALKILIVGGYSRLVGHLPKLPGYIITAGIAGFYVVTMWVALFDGILTEDLPGYLG